MQIKREWFASWFDSPYYHILYKNRDQSEAKVFIQNLLQELQPEANSKALDLACGKGRHSLVLANAGLDVLGADLSEQSIEIAKRLEMDNLHFKVHDMREPFCEKDYDYIFNLFTSFGYFSKFIDNLKTINSIHASLKEKGVFILDFLNAKKTISQLNPYSQLDMEDISFEIERKVENSTIIKTIYIYHNGECKHFQERVQALELADFEAYFYNKFKIKKLFGDYQLNPFDSKDSDRLIIIAEKR